MKNILLLSALILGAATGAHADSKATYESSCAPVIMETILDLESRRDAKCYATATRVENFMYGVPLLQEAQVRKTELQKMLIRQMWIEATRSTDGEVITPADLKPILANIMPTEKDEDGGIHFNNPEKGRMSLTNLDMSHYGGIAYALRAILSVQQDELIQPTADLGMLDKEAIEVMKEFIDVYTLFALRLASEHALVKGASKLSAEDIEIGWNQVHRMEEQGAASTEGS